MSSPRLLLSVAAFALVSTAPLSAQETATEAPPETTVEEPVEAPVKQGTPALWKVADEDTTIYLFGTVHILPKNIDWYGGPLETAFDSSDTIVTEIRMDAESEAAMQQMALQRAMLPEGMTLRSILDAEQTATYEAALGKLGVPPAAFDQFEPWMAGLTLTVLPLVQQGYASDSGVEKVLMDRAGEKELGALETAEFQIGVFDSLSQEQQVTFLMEAAEGVDDIKAYLDRMVAEWLEGDADELAVIMNESLTDPELANVLLYQRNANWAEWIEGRLDQPGTVFIAVGAGHLAGEKSVQDYLAEREIDTSRVQ